MSILYGLKAIQGNAGSNLPFIFGFNTARSVANDDLLELWNGPTVAGIKFAVDKDGKSYSAAAVAGDILYAVTGGIANVRRFDSLAIGGAATYLRSTGAVPAWATISATEITVGNLPYAQLPTTGAGGTWATGGNLTLSGGRLLVLSADDVNLAGVSGGLIVGGNGTAAHIAIDPNEIMAKSDATTAATLGINADGGDVQIGANRTTEATDLTLLIKCGDAAGANTRNVVVDWSMGVTRWRMGMTGSVNWRLFDVVNNLSVLTAAPSASLIDVTLNSATTTGSVDGRFSINAGTNAGANNRDAMLEFRRGQTGLWRAGVLGSISATDAFRIRDLVNSQTALAFTTFAADPFSATFGTDLTTESLGTHVQVRAGTAAGANNRDAALAFLRSSTVLWREGVLGSVAADATWRLRDVVNGSNAIVVTPGATPAVAFNGALSGITTLSAAGPITLTTATARIIPGVTSFAIRNNANSADNLLVNDAGDVTARTTLTIVGGELFLQPAISRIVPGATSLSLRNNANSADNILITDAGIVTLRNALRIPFGTQALPAIAWSGETSTGIYNTGSNIFFGVLNRPRVEINNSICLGLYPTGSNNGALSIYDATVTANVTVIDAYQTWSNAGVAFDGIRLTITNTASAAGSRLLNLFVGASSVFSVNVSGSVFVGANQVVSARITGYSAMTGTPNKATVYDTATVTLAQLAGRVMQLQADLTTHGMIGS